MKLSEAEECAMEMLHRKGGISVLAVTKLISNENSVLAVLMIWLAWALLLAWSAGIQPTKSSSRLSYTPNTNCRSSEVELSNGSTSWCMDRRQWEREVGLIDGK